MEISSLTKSKHNIIDLNSYIRISDIREDFEKDCLYVNNIDDVLSIDVYKHKNIIFENTQLKNLFFERLSLRDINHTIINCLSSYELFSNSLLDVRGIVLFDNVCACRNNDILKEVIKYKGKKLLVC